MKALYSLLLIIALVVNAVARPPEPDPTPNALNEGCALQFDADNQIYHFKWWGRTGRTYFVQSTQDLISWNWVPVIETGEDAIKEWAFTSTADKFFVRLRYTDRYTYDPLNEDFDGDGVSNILEVQQGSDPFDYYSQPAGVITPLLTIASGDNQSTVIDQYAAQPIVVLVTDTSSTPLSNAPVTVTAATNALLSATTSSSTLTNSLALRTNTQGQAIAYIWSQGEPGTRYFTFVPTDHTSPALTVSTTVIASAPVAPAELISNRTEANEVRLMWTDASTNEDGFTIYRSDDGGTTWTAIGTTSANITSYTVDPTNAGTGSSIFKALAMNALGQSNSSNQANTPDTKPALRYAIMDLGSDHTRVIKIANSGHVLARGNGTSIAGWRWYNNEWSSLTHSEENGSVIDMNNSGTVLGSCSKSGKGWKDTYWSVSIKAATWAANSTTAALSPSATGSAYYNDVLVSEGGAPQDPVDIRQPFGIDDNGAVYSCDVSGNNPYADPPPSSVFTDYAYTLGSEAQSVHKTVPFGWDFPIRIGPVCTAGCVQSAEPDYEYTYDGATLDFTPIDINNDGAVVGDTSIFHGGSTETLPATALAINNRHYPPGDTGAPDWQIISSTNLMEKERNEDGSPGTNYKSTAITVRTPESLTQTYSAITLSDINDHGVIVATAKKNGADHAILMTPAALGVDANRDGFIKFAGNENDSSVKGKEVDYTTQEKPFRFWVNSDRDDSENNETIGSSTKDSDDMSITTKRDLEDFTRLYIYMGGLQDAVTSGQIVVGLKWKNTTGSPSIRVYPAVDNSTSYVTDDDVAGQQISGTYGAAITSSTGHQQVDAEGLKLPTSFWDGLTATNSSKYMIFEGKNEGKGQLVIAFYKSDGTEIGEGPGVWIDLKNIKKMYQRYDSATAHPWENVAFEADPNEDKQVIVFVHGWRMSPEGASNFSETMYKRLWQRGYKGRFAAFHWDTWWHDSAQWAPYVGEAIDAYLANYNDSEHTAWQSASALKNFVNSMPSGYARNIVAHSMGNIVTGEALLQGMSVANYALLQAAAPAACFDDDEGRIKQTTQTTHSAGPLTFTMWDSVTPDGDTDSVTRGLAYRGRFKNISANLINFYLPQDNATSYAWEINNDQTKPPVAGTIMDFNFEYAPGNSSGQKLYKFHVETNPLTLEMTSVRDYYLSDPYEAMPYACRTWGKATGAFGSTGGAVTGSIDLSSPTYGGTAGFATEHSAEFNRNIQQLKAFYDQLLDTFGLKGTP